MEKATIQKENAYAPPEHFGCSCMKVQGTEETGLKKFWQGVSIFAPDGGANWQYGEGTFGADKEKTYFVLEGQITVENEAGEKFVLDKYDSVSMLPFEKRKMWNSAEVEAKVVVTISY
ncbi:MAG: cupin domain-containing protein [Desulfuromusa sp.]|nr:cupin domain-containing protein [Desulfuromusa sp.]